MTKSIIKFSITNVCNNKEFLFHFIWMDIQYKKRHLMERGWGGGRDKPYNVSSTQKKTEVSHLNARTKFSMSLSRLIWNDFLSILYCTGMHTENVIMVGIPKLIWFVGIFYRRTWEIKNGNSLICHTYSHRKG